MQKVCKQCQAQFEVTPKDLDFYDKVSPVFQGKKYSIPPPTLCPDCRQQRRLSWRNERTLYNRNCDLCKRHIVSVYPMAALFPVYCVRCWWSDQWDSFSYGIDYDFSIPFLKQFQRLRERVPQLAIQNDEGISSENSEYCYDVSHAKNCYRVIGSWYIQDCHFSLNVNRSRDVVDCNTTSIDCELVYESLDSQRLYHCAYLQNCEGCRDCFFGYDLRGCSDCFCCFGLRQKRFCMFNEQLVEKEYRRRIAEFNLDSFAMTRDMRVTFDHWALRFPRKYANLQNCEDCVGNNLFNCKSVLGYSVFNSEYSKFIDRSDGPKYSYDLINTGDSQWCYDCVTPDNSYMVAFSVWCWKCKNIFLSDNCHSSEQLLGCVSVRRGKYCILNKRYTKGEYEELAGRIIESLQKDEWPAMKSPSGTRCTSWGEHLPISHSPFGYNETAAAEYYPLSRDEVLRRGWKWNDVLPHTMGKETQQWDAVADNIRDVPDEIIQEVLACMECRKNYNITPQELKFYRKMPVPIPRLCPDCRHLQRFHRKTPTHLWKRQCKNCAKEIQTTYAPNRPETVYCESCYLSVVY